MVPYLSTGLNPLSKNERAQTERTLQDLETIISGGNSDTEENEKLTLVTKMFMAKPSAAMTDMGAAARGEMYMHALYDLPAWAIGEAIKRWYRGDVDGVSLEDFRWAPDSAVLRRIAATILLPYQKNIETIRQLLDAKPLDELM